MELEFVCDKILPILRIIAFLLKVIQWAIPMLLIAFATFDVVKAVVANDDKQMESAKSSMVKRLIYAVIVFLVPVVIRIIFGLIADNISGGDYLGPGAWIGCFEQAFNDV